MSVFDTEIFRALVELGAIDAAERWAEAQRLALETDAIICGGSKGGYFWFGRNLIDDARERVIKRD